MTKTASKALSIVKLLGGNVPNERERGMKLLKPYILTECRSDEDFLTIWKGIHYYFWMNDKNHEDVADQIADLTVAVAIENSDKMDDDKQIELGFKYWSGFLLTEAREYERLDQHRTNKYLMLVRQMLHQTFELMRNYNWRVNDMRKFCKTVDEKLFFSSRDPRTVDHSPNLKRHFIDILFEELEVYNDELQAEHITILLNDLLLKAFMSTAIDSAVKRHMKTHILDNLIERCYSDIVEPQDNTVPLPVDWKQLIKHLKDLSANCPHAYEKKTLQTLCRTLTDIVEKKAANHPNIELDKVFTIPDETLSHKDVEKAVVRMEKLEKELSGGKNKGKNKKRKFIEALEDMEMDEDDDTELVKPLASAQRKKKMAKNAKASDFVALPTKDKSMAPKFEVVPNADATPRVKFNEAVLSSAFVRRPNLTAPDMRNVLAKQTMQQLVRMRRISRHREAVRDAANAAKSTTNDGRVNAKMMDNIAKLEKLLKVYEDRGNRVKSEKFRIKLNTLKNELNSRRQKALIGNVETDMAHPTTPVAPNSLLKSPDQPKANGRQVARQRHVMFSPKLCQYNDEEDKEKKSGNTTPTKSNGINASTDKKAGKEGAVKNAAIGANKRAKSKKRRNEKRRFNRT